MNDPLLHQEADEIADSTSFSGVAILGLLFSLAGVFSVRYVQMLPVALVGGALGAIALVTASRYRLNLISRIFAFLGLVIGITFASWGMFERGMKSSYDLTQGRRIGELYLNSLSANELEKIYYLAGFQFDGESPEQQEEAKQTELQRAKTRVATDPAHTEIRTRKTPAKWVFVSLDGEFDGTLGRTYRLRYRDEGQTIPSAYWIYARKTPREVNGRNEVHWFVDNLERVKQ
jgi:hypothetical protein